MFDEAVKYAPQITGPVTAYKPHGFLMAHFCSIPFKFRKRKTPAYLMTLQLVEPKSFRPLMRTSQALRRRSAIRTSRMGVCGTDVSCHLENFFFDYLRIPGHELGVEVLEIERAYPTKPRDRCSVEPTELWRLPCMPKTGKLLRKPRLRSDGWRAVRTFDHPG